MPLVASVTSSPVRCPPRADGASAATRSANAARSCDLTRAEQRSAATSLYQAIAARTTTTRSSTTSGPRSCPRSFPSAAAPTMITASSQAWATTRTAVAAPSTTDRRR